MNRYRFKYSCNLSCEITLPLGVSFQLPSFSGTYTSGSRRGSNKPHWNASRISNMRLRSSRRRRYCSRLLNGLAGNSPGNRSICLLLVPMPWYTFPELRFILTRTLFPRAPATPAHLGPIPLAMLAGDFKARPHFLHLGFPSIVILLNRIHQLGHPTRAGVVLEQRDLILHRMPGTSTATRPHCNVPL